MERESLGTRLTVTEHAHHGVYTKYYKIQKLIHTQFTYIAYIFMQSTHNIYSTQYTTGLVYVSRAYNIHVLIPILETSFVLPAFTPVATQRCI